jgi:hypothetical protein
MLWMGTGTVTAHDVNLTTVFSCIHDSKTLLTKISAQTLLLRVYILNVACVLHLTALHCGNSRHHYTLQTYTPWACEHMILGLTTNAFDSSIGPVTQPSGYHAAARRTSMDTYHIYVNVEAAQQC